MTKPFNPSRVIDMLDESLYASGSKGEELAQKRVKLVAWLRIKGKNSQACLNLADRLQACRPHHRCRSAACPECARAGQRLIADAVRRFLKAKVIEGAKIVCVTIVPKDGMIKPGKLRKADHERALRRWKERLGKAGVTWFIGATDFSLNEHKRRAHGPQWSEHIYGITVIENPKKLKRLLKKQFPKAKAIPRPVKVVEWDGDRRALLYIAKPNFSRRIATDDGQRFNPKTGATRLCHETDTQPLKSKQRRELLLHLEDVGMQSRLLLRYVQMVMKPNGPSLKLCPPKGQNR
jgi:hypothetical protein